MANAKKCDRCGRYYEVYNIARCNEKINGVIRANIDVDGTYYSNEKIEFCPDCKDSFEKWLSDIPEE